MSFLATLTQQREELNAHRSQIKNLTAEGNFFERLLAQQRKRLVALGDTEEEETYLLQLVHKRQHQITQKLLELDRKVFEERNSIAQIETKIRECAITTPSTIPYGAVVLVKSVHRNENGGRLSLESIAPFTLTNYHNLETELGASVGVLHLGNVVQHPFCVDVWTGQNIPDSVVPGSLLYK